MYCIAIHPPDRLDGFRIAARKLLAAEVEPDQVDWSGASLFGTDLPDATAIAAVPAAFVTLAEAVACHRDSTRWSLLYQALWRIHRGQRTLLDQAADPLVHRLHRLAKAVRHDAHRMTAFVRFRAAGDGDAAHYVAWYEPRHRVLRHCAEFFVDRFAAMRFSILTPDLTLHWDRTTLAFAPGLRREDAVSADTVEAWWQRYYGAVFNPARINEPLLRAHIPQHFWRNLPEAAVIADLVAGAGRRTERMLRQPASAPGRDGSTAPRNALG